MPPVASAMQLSWSRVLASGTRPSVSMVRPMPLAAISRATSHGSSGWQVSSPSLIRTIRRVPSPPFRSSAAFSSAGPIGVQPVGVRVATAVLASVRFRVPTGYSCAVSLHPVFRSLPW